MNVIKKVHKFILDERFRKDKRNVLDLVQYLKKLQILEAKLWGVSLIHVSNEEEEVLEDTNHLINIIVKEDYQSIKKVLSLKTSSDFIENLEKLRNDFMYFRKQVKERNKLKDLISKVTIKYVNHNNYTSLENIFILEKNLYEVLDIQEEKLNKIFSELPRLKSINDNKLKVESFLEELRNIRIILSGHIDDHDFYKEERLAYSNSSNIIYSLIKLVDILNKSDQIKV